MAPLTQKHTEVINTHSFTIMSSTTRALLEYTPQTHGQANVHHAVQANVHHAVPTHSACCHDMRHIIQDTHQRGAHTRRRG